MLAIAWAMLGGWILSWFGFKAVVIAGMLQVFGVTINTLGYYFLFAMFGATRKVAVLTNSGTAEKTKESTKNVGKAITNIRKK